MDNKQPDKRGVFSIAPTNVVNTTAPSIPVPPMAPASAAPPETPAAPTMSPMRIAGTALASHSSPAPEPEPLTPGQAQLAADNAKMRQVYDAAFGGYRDKDGYLRSYRTPGEWAAFNDAVAEQRKDIYFREAMGQDYIPREALADTPRRLRIKPPIDRRGR